MTSASGAAVVLQSPAKGFIWSLFAYATYSTHDAIVKLLGDYSVFQIVFFAMLFACVPFSLALLREPHPISFKPRNSALVALRSLLLVGALLFAFAAFALLPMVQVYVLIFTTPLLVTLLAIPLLGERVHAFRWSAILLGLAGIVIVLRPTPDAVSVGHLLGLLSAGCAAGAAIIARKVGSEESAATMMLYPLLVNIGVTGVGLLWVYQPMPLADLLLMFAIGALGLVAQFALLQAFRHAPAGMVAPMQYSQLVWGVLIGAVFFAEPVDRWVILGAAITILSGTLIIWHEMRLCRARTGVTGLASDALLVRGGHGGSM